MENCHKMTSNDVKRRLISVFGKHGADLILMHLDNLDAAFGSEAASIIRFIENGAENEHS